MSEEERAHRGVSTDRFVRLCGVGCAGVGRAAGGAGQPCPTCSPRAPGKYGAAGLPPTDIRRSHRAPELRLPLSARHNLRLPSQAGSVRRRSGLTSR